MNCQTCDERLSDYADKGVTPAERGVIEAHLSSCPACTAQLHIHLSMLEALGTWPVEKAPADAWMRFEAAMDLEDAVSPEAPSHAPAIGSPQASIDALLGAIDVSASRSSGEDPGHSPGGALQALRRLWLSWQAWAMPLAVAALVFVTLRVTSTPSGSGVAPVPAPVLAIAPAQRATPPQRRIVTPPILAPRQRPGVAQRQVQPMPLRHMVMQRKRPSSRGHHPAVMAALHSLAMAQQQYQRALTSLEQVARKKLMREKAAPRNRHLLRLLARIDHSIAEARQIISRQPDATRTHRVLVAMYQRKVEILRDVILDD